MLLYPTNTRASYRTPALLSARVTGFAARKWMRRNWWFKTHPTSQACSIERRAIVPVTFHVPTILSKRSSCMGRPGPSAGTGPLDAFFATEGRQRLGTLKWLTRGTSRSSTESTSCIGCSDEVPECPSALDLGAPDQLDTNAIWIT